MGRSGLYRSALNYFPPYGPLAPYTRSPASGSFVRWLWDGALPPPVSLAAPPRPPALPSPPCGLRRAARFFLTAGGLVGPVGRVARVARSLSLALLRVGRENFSRPCPRALCCGWVCGLFPPPRFARPPRFRLPARSRRPPCRPALLYALAVRRKSIRAARPLLRLSAPRVLGGYGGGGGVCGVCFLILS